MNGLEPHDTFNRRCGEILRVSINGTIPLEKGTYVIFKIRAKDIFDAESD